MKKKIILAIIVIGIIGGAIYYYEIRPAMIRSDCNWTAYEPMLKVWGENKTTGSPQLYSAYYELLYRNCIRNKGINE